MTDIGAKTRQSNIELLRIVSMLMIITLHYLDKGNVLVEFAAANTANQFFAWVLEAFCFGAVNLYVLISGYFLVESKFTFKKLTLLWAQILFYSWGIGMIFLVGGWLTPEQKSLYELIFTVLPVSSGHYWFATVYVILFAIFPFLNAAIRQMNRAQHKAGIIVSLILFSGWNTFLSMTQPMADGKGMDIVWFVCLYLMAAYLRKYPDCIKRKVWIYAAGYVVFTLSVFVFGQGVLLIEKLTGKLGGYETQWYAYNSLPIFLASVCLFIVFIKMPGKQNGIGKGINLFAGATFGVYLIHENRHLRYLWPEWFLVEQCADTPWMIIHLAGSILTIFFACAGIELVRKWLFSLFTNRKWFQALFVKLESIEDKINGVSK